VTAANPLSAPAGKSGRSGWVRRTRLAFRQWRRTRPFWGGLLVLLGGGEILSTTVVSLGPTFRVGLGGVNGFVGTMIAFVLTLCGLLLWFSPAQRVFYSIVAIVLALATFNTINYGGFFLGMLLGIIGGAMAFAWSQAAERGRPRRRLGHGGLGLVPGKGRPGDETPDAPADGGHRTLSLVIAPLVLSLAAASGLHAQPAAPPAGGQHTAPAQLAVHSSAPQGCILLILCTSSPKPKPSGGPSPRPTGSSTPSPGGSGSPAGNPGSQGKSKGKIKRTSAPHGLVAAAVPTVLTASSARKR
jgi:hypothetical protein